MTTVFSLLPGRRFVLPGLNNIVHELELECSDIDTNIQSIDDWYTDLQTYDKQFMEMS